MYVQSLGWEDPLEHGMTTCSSILAWRTPWTEEAGRATIHGVTEMDTTERLMLSFYVKDYTNFRRSHLHFLSFFFFSFVQILQKLFIKIIYVTKICYISSMIF